MEQFWYNRIEDNKNIPNSYKRDIYNLFDTSKKISFGRIAPRQDGYIMGDDKYPRCTSIMSMDGIRAAALMEWAKKEIVCKIQESLLERLKTDEPWTEMDVVEMTESALNEPDRQRDEAANEGTGAHDNIENWLKGLPCKTDERLLQFQEIWARERVELICTELPIVYGQPDGLGFGGRLDILAFKDGEFFIYDNKTSKSVHQGYALQISAYKAAVEQMSNNKIYITGGKIIHLPNLPALKKWQLDAYKKLGPLVECYNLEKAFEHYKILLNQYKNRNNKYF